MLKMMVCALEPSANVHLKELLRAYFRDFGGFELCGIFDEKMIRGLENELSNADFSGVSSEFGGVLNKVGGDKIGGIFGEVAEKNSQNSVNFLENSQENSRDFGEQNFDDFDGRVFGENSQKSVNFLGNLQGKSQNQTTNSPRALFAQNDEKLGENSQNAVLIHKPLFDSHEFSAMGFVEVLPLVFKAKKAIAQLVNLALQRQNSQENRVNFSQNNENLGENSQNLREQNFDDFNGRDFGAKNSQKSVNSLENSQENSRKPSQIHALNSQNLQKNSQTKNSQFSIQISQENSQNSHPQTTQNSQKNSQNLTQNLQKNSRPQPSSKPLDIILCIDSPAFNIPLAKALNKAGVKAAKCYYILPQVWAWKKGRVPIIEANFDVLASILPFDEKYFAKCVFMGHPLLDEIKDFKNEADFERILSKDERQKTIAFLPGSRQSEITRLMPIFRELAANFKGEKMLCVPPFNLDKIKKLYGDTDGFKIVTSTPQALKKSDFAFVCSGTATLEAALIGTPFILAYKAKAIDVLIARLFVRLRHIGLANIMCDFAGQTPLHPEFLQDAVSAKNLFEAYRNFDYKEFFGKVSFLKSYLGFGSAKNLAKALWEHKCKQKQ